jgi:hypothetical protein
MVQVLPTRYNGHGKPTGTRLFSNDRLKTEHRSTGDDCYQLLMKLIKPWRREIMKFYVASSFKNVNAVRLISEKLKLEGYIQTYDWTQNDRDLTIEQLRELGQKEKKAVIAADFIVVVLPAGKGSHIELGIALGLGKKVYIHSPNGEVNNMAATSTFYHLEEVEACTGTIEELVEYITVSIRPNSAVRRTR